MPARETAPEASVPGGAFADPVSVTLSVLEGWQAYSTLDGTDPRLSKSRTEYTKAITIATSSVLRAAAISTPVDFDAGNWTDVTEHEFAIGEPLQIPFIRGDVNADGGLSVSDAVVLLRFLFRAGFAPSCQQSADLDANGGVSIDDGIALLKYLYSDGARPEAPFPACGVVESFEGRQIDCEAFSPCDS